MENNSYTKQNKWVKIAFLLLNVAIVAIIFLLEKKRNGTIPALDETLKATENGTGFILLSFLMVALIILCESLSISFILHKSGYNYRFFLSLKTVLIGKYYDNITPFAVGGQPVQMYYLSTRGIEQSVAYSVPLVKHTVRSIMVCIVTIIAYIVIKNDAALTVKIAAYVGLGMTLMLPVFLILFGFNRAFGTKLAMGIVKIGVKLKIVKNELKAKEKMTKLVDEFQSSIQYLTTNPDVFFIVGFLSVVQLVATMTIPYFVVRGFGAETDYLDAFVKGLYAMNGAAFIPTPGTAGGAEAFFYALFGSVLSPGTIFWAIILWRTCNFYIYLVIGNIINIIDTIHSLRYNKKHGKKMKQIIDYESGELTGLQLQEMMKVTAESNAESINSEDENPQGREKHE